MQHTRRSGLRATMHTRKEPRRRKWRTDISYGTNRPSQSQSQSQPSHQHPTMSGQAKAHQPLQPLQPRSGLGSLKRSWSGSSHDLAKDGHGELIVAPTKAQRRLQSAQGTSDSWAHKITSNYTSESNDSVPLDGSAWQPTPPERQHQIRQNFFKYDENGHRGESTGPHRRRSNSRRLL